MIFCQRLNSEGVLFAQIYPDPELEQQILALAIRCIHSEEGCRWTGQMKQLQVTSSTAPRFLPDLTPPHKTQLDFHRQDEVFRRKQILLGMKFKISQLHI